MENTSPLKLKLKDIILAKMDLSKDLSDEEILDIIDETVIYESKNSYISLEEKKRLRIDIFNSIRRLDILQELIDDHNITEIMINGEDNIFIEKDGKVRKWNQQFESKKKLEDVIQQIVSGANRIVNESSPIVDARLMEELKNNKH